MRRIHLGGLLFEGGSGETTYTVESDSVRGWLLDGVDMRLEQVERPSAHGSFSLPGYLTGRSISWGGLILTDTPQEQEHAMRSLSGLLAGGLTDRLTIENTSSQWSTVKRAGEFDMRMRAYGRVASYRLQLWAPDPRIYGDVHNFTAGQGAVHYGNAPARPVFTVTGTAPGGYTITGTNGQVITVTYPVVPGWPHRIDTAKGGLFVNGNRVIGGISVWNPKPVGPGLPAVTFSITAGVALQVDVTDTFI